MTESLEFTAIACELAQAIFYSARAAFSQEPQRWESLSVEARHIYVTQAADVLRAHRPVSLSESPLFHAFTAVTRQHGDKIAGRIEPAYPWGISHEP